MKKTNNFIGKWVGAAFGFWILLLITLGLVWLTKFLLGKAF